MNFVVAVLTLVAAYAIAALGAALVQRQLGLLSIAHGAVLGTGAYAYAVADRANWSFGLSLCLAAFAGALISVLILILAERVVGQDFALWTFALQLVWLGIVSNWRELTGGALGIAGITGYPFSGLLGRGIAGVGFVLAGLVIAFFTATRVETGQFSNSAAIVGRSKELARTLGVSTVLTWTQLGVVSGALLGLAGAFFAAHLSFIDPLLFGTGTSVVILGIAFLGISGNLLRVLAGAVLLIGVPELLRLFGIMSTRTGYLQLLLGGAIVAVAAATLMSVSETGSDA